MCLYGWIFVRLQPGINDDCRSLTLPQTNMRNASLHVVRIIYEYSHFLLCFWKRRSDAIYNSIQ